MDTRNQRDDALRDKTEVQSLLESTRKEMAVFETKLNEEKVTIASKMYYTRTCTVHNTCTCTCHNSLQ